MPGAAALGADDGGYVAATLIKDCDGVALRAFDRDGKDSDGQTQRCAAIKGAKAGNAAIAVLDKRIWV